MNNDKRSYESVGYRNHEHLMYEKEHGKYTHYVPISYGELMGKSLEEHYYTEFENLEDLYLSNATPSIPSKLNGMGYVELDNYIIDFWGYILPPLAIQVLTTLLRWSFRKGYTNISIAELSERMGKQRSTIRNAIDVLEENFFLIKFQRKLKDTGKEAPNKSNVFIRLREDTPMLSKEQLGKLPKFLQEEHEDIVDKINRARFDEHKQLLVAPSKRAFVRNFVIDKCKSENRVDRDISFIIKEHGIEPLVNSIISVDYEFDKFVKDECGKGLSKPSYDVLIKNSVFVLENEGQVMTIICQDEYVEEHLKTGYAEQFITSLFEKISVRTGVELADYIVVSFSKYYKALINKQIF